MSQKENLTNVLNATQKMTTFSDLAEIWLQEKKMFFKESTIVKYQNIINLHLIPEFERYALEEFTYDNLYQFRTKLLRQRGRNGNGLSPKTVSDILSLLHSILRHAKNHKILIPAADFMMPVKQQKKKIRIFSINEQKRLFQYLKANCTYSNTGILLCLFTGLRIGEVCALTWKDILLEEQSLFVHQTMQRLQTDKNETKKTKVIISSPKSFCSIRYIPIPDEIFGILKSKQSPPEAFLLTGNASKYIEPRTLQYQFKKILHECGIENANFHMLRHTFATRCIEIGFDLKSLSEILGHANTNITLNCYMHPSMDLKRKNMDKFSILFH
ncbi:MAG: site-specific integrase [Eubacterium sp.]|nr:site-specific integrase [Eubacterium sp.]